MIIGLIGKGADLVTIMCSEEAGIPIKCYSPELIVCPVIQLKDCAEESDQFKQVCETNYNSIVSLLDRIDSVSSDRERVVILS